MFSETWKHEGGIASIRLSQWSGESFYAYVQTARQAVKEWFLESFDGSEFCFIILYFKYNIYNNNFGMTEGEIYFTIIVAKS